MRRMHCHGVSIIRATPTRMQGGRFARASQATLGERAKSWGPSCRRLRALIVFVCLHAGATRTELAPALAYGDGLSPSKRRIAVSTSGVFPRMERIACECGAIPAISRRAANNPSRDKLAPLNKKYPMRRSDSLDHHGDRRVLRRHRLRRQLYCGLERCFRPCVRVERRLAGLPRGLSGAALALPAPIRRSHRTRRATSTPR